jgi:hypothetical protein
MKGSPKRRRIHYTYPTRGGKKAFQLFKRLERSRPQRFLGFTAAKPVSRLAGAETFDNDISQGFFVAEALDRVQDFYAG